MYRTVILGIFICFFTSSQGQSSLTGNINDYYGDKWNGLIPHFHPFNTTDYHGSGDINLDTKLDQTDFEELRKIISGAKQPNIRADVNGDGIVTSEDEQLIINAINGGILPGWWNYLQNKDARISWLSKMVSIDQTDKHPYITGKYECSNFARQFFNKFTGYNVFLDYTSQPVFNLPVYYVLINPPTGTSHNLNAILVGDDPYNFSEWIFVEPQNDEFVSLTNYPLGTEISMMPMYSFPLIVFKCTSSGNFELKSFNSSLVRYKPAVQPDIKNYGYAWYPELISNNRILFEKTADDMSRVSKIHINNLDSLSILSGTPLTSSKSRTHRILAKSRHNGSTDLIWEESFNDSSSYYFGSISDESRLVNIQELTFLKNSGFHSVDLYINESKAFMFWLSNSPDNLSKLFYSEMMDNRWQEMNYIQLAQSDYPVAEYKAGEDQHGILHLFATSKNEYRHKLVVYSFDNNWKETYRIENVIGKDIFFAGTRFFIWSWRVPERASDIAVYSKTETGWSVNYSIFYGIPMKIIETGIREKPVYIIGTSKWDGNYFLESAWVNDSYITIDRSFREFNLSNNISTLLENKQVKVAWFDTSDRCIDLFKYYIEITYAAENNDTEKDEVLMQNFPNPFNSETKIRFNLKIPDFVNIKIYDILGKEVSELNNKWESAGEHVISFDGNNLSSGIYMYKMRTSHSSSFRKMILAK